MLAPYQRDLTPYPGGGMNGFEARQRASTSADQRASRPIVVASTL